MIPTESRSIDHADTVGLGVHRQRVVPGPTPEVDTEEAPISLDGPVEWSDTPTFPDQITRGPAYWKLDRVEAKVFDLAIGEEVKAYSNLLTDTSKPGSNMCLTHQDRQFSTVTGNWKVFTEIQYIKFRKIFAKDKKA